MSTVPRRLRPASLPLLLLAALGLAACGAEDAVPDLVYEVTVESVVEDGSLSTDCISEGRVYQQTFSYEIFVNEEEISLSVDGESFAIGSRSGCALSYTSAIWLEERPSGDLRWIIRGEADYEGAAGGCDLPDGVDWQGTEEVEVVESADESVPAGCTYQLQTTGTYVSGG